MIVENKIIFHNLFYYKKRNTALVVFFNQARKHR